MSLRFALLGFLSRSPATGYDLTRQFREQLHYWNAHHTQIYRELAKMESEGLVESEVVQQETHPDKKVYKISKKGINELIHWILHEPSSSANIKDPFLLRTAAFHLISPEEAIQLLEEVKQREEYILEMTRKWQEKTFGNNPPEYDEIGKYLTSEYGVMYAKSYIEWCNWAISILKQISSRSKNEK